MEAHRVFFLLGHCLISWLS